MALKTFNKENCGYRSTAAPTLCISPVGNINLNAPLISLMGLKENDTVEFFQDEKSTEDWWIAKSKSKEGFNLRFDNQKLNARVQNAFLAREILKNCNQDDVSNRCPITPLPVKLENKMDGYLILISQSKPTLVKKK